jgi:hypothetical protein
MTEFGVCQHLVLKLTVEHIDKIKLNYKNFDIKLRVFTKVAFEKFKKS